MPNELQTRAKRIIRAIDDRIQHQNDLPWWQVTGTSRDCLSESLGIEYGIIEHILTRISDKAAEDILKDAERKLNLI
jgi:hypothetical protein